MRKSWIVLAAASCLMFNGLTQAQTYTSVQTLGKLPIVGSKGTGVLDLTSLVKSNSRLTFAVRDPKSGKLSYTHESTFYGKADGYFYQGKNRLQGYSTAANSNSCELTDVKMPPENIPAVATSTIMWNGNLNAGSSPPLAPLDPNNPESYNFTLISLIYDSLGNPHQARVFFVNDSPNRWIASVYMDDLFNIGSGHLVFDPTGRLMFITGLSNLIFDPKNGAALQGLSFNFAAFTQFADSFSASPLFVNGMPAGEYSHYTVDDNGYFTAFYSNRESIMFSRIPVFGL